MRQKWSAVRGWLESHQEIMRQKWSAVQSWMESHQAIMIQKWSAVTLRCPGVTEITKPLRNEVVSCPLSAVQDWHEITPRDPSWDRSGQLSRVDRNRTKILWDRSGQLSRLDWNHTKRLSADWNHQEFKRQKWSAVRCQLPRVNWNRTRC